MPSVFGKDSKRKELINVKEIQKNSNFLSLFFLFKQNLDVIYEKIEREHNIPLGDFPKIDRMQDILRNMVCIQIDFSFYKKNYKIFFNFYNLGFHQI